HLSTQVSVSSRSYEADLSLGLSIDQHPVRFDVAVSSPLPFSEQRMVLCRFRQRSTLKEKSDYLRQLVRILASLDLRSNILFELGRLRELHSSAQLAVISSRESNSSIPSFRSLWSRTSAVNAL